MVAVGHCLMGWRAFNLHSGIINLARGAAGGRKVLSSKRFPTVDYLLFSRASGTERRKDKKRRPKLQDEVDKQMSAYLLGGAL